MPEVYILIIPGFGIISTTISASSNKLVFGQDGSLNKKGNIPRYFIIYLTQQTISGESFWGKTHKLRGILDVSYIVRTCTAKIKILLKAVIRPKSNPQVTKTLSSWVGTSEAIRLFNIQKRLNYNLTSGKRDLKFIQWLSGLIDGDGCFLLSKKGYASLEITMSIRDEHALQIVKNVYGGSIKLRSNTKAIRYRLHHKSGLLNLINDVNGNIRNPNRLTQLNKICLKYDILLVLPVKLIANNGWLSGFFDSDGSISINTSSDFCLSITASQKTTELLNPLLDLYGGGVHISTDSLFKWKLSKQTDVLNLIEYFKKYPSRSGKKNRLHLVPQFYELKQMKAHLAQNDTLLGKSWKIFMAKWIAYH